MTPRRPGWLQAASVLLLATLFAASRPSHAQGETPNAHRTESAAVPSPMFCAPTGERDYDRDLWTDTDLDKSPGTQLMELKWIPARDDEQVGTIDCVYAPNISRIPYPTLHSRFVVERPVTPGWMRPSPTVDWLLCSGATMTHFDARQCPFVPAEPLPGPDRKHSPFGAG